MTTEHPGEVAEYMDTFSDLSGLLGHNSIIPCRHHPFQAKVISTHCALQCYLDLANAQLDFRNDKIDSDTRRLQVLVSLYTALVMLVKSDIQRDIQSFLRQSWSKIAL